MTITNAFPLVSAVMNDDGKIADGTNYIYSLRMFFFFSSSAEPDHELFLVYGKGRPGIIRGMDMNAKVPDEYMIPIENLMNPRALDFHAASEFIYFADATSYIIGRQKIDGTERDTILKEGKNELMALPLVLEIIYTLSPDPGSYIEFRKGENSVISFPLYSHDGNPELAS